MRAQKMEAPGVEPGTFSILDANEMSYHLDHTPFLDRIKIGNLHQ